MKVRNGVIAAAALALSVAVVARGRAQGQPPPGPQPGAPQTAEPQGQPPAGGAQPLPEHGGQQPPATSPGGSDRRELPRFPAHQRPAADAAVLARGKGLYAGSCSACHGADARGGQLGGVNLLRSQLMLNDQDGELILPVVQNGRPGTLMVPIPMAPEDVKAVASYLHSLQAQGSNQGGPPPGEEVVLNIVVGDAAAGSAFFTAKCSSCHSATGDMQGIATRIPDGKMLQNAWVAGGSVRGRGPRAAGSTAPTVTATVTLASGEKVEGRLVRIDDFIVALAQADGGVRSFRRDGDLPTIDVHDPLAGHRELLAVYTDKNMHDVTAYLATLK